MMSKSKILATLVALVSSTSLCLADGTWTCPSQAVMNGTHVKDLAKTGKTVIGTKTYQMVSEKVTGNNFNKKLLDTQKHLEGFITISGFKADTLKQTDARVVSIKEEPGKHFCAYNISIGTNSAVVALEDSGASVAPTRPAHSAPMGTHPTTPKHSGSPHTPPPVPKRTYSPPSEPPPLPPEHAVSEQPSTDTDEGATGGGLLAEIRKRKKLNHVDQDSSSDSSANPSTGSTATPSSAAKPNTTAQPSQGMSMMDELKKKQQERLNRGG